MEAKPLILIVDDSDDFREIWKVKFSLSGFDVIEAKSGKEAIEILKTHKPDIILLDFLMPEMSGADTYFAIKKNPETKDIKIFFLTSMDKLDSDIIKSNQESAEELAKVPYISKTKDLNEIVNIIKKELGID